MCVCVCDHIHAVVFLWGWVGLGASVGELVGMCSMFYNCYAIVYECAFCVYVHVVQLS